MLSERAPRLHRSPLGRRERHHLCCKFDVGVGLRCTRYIRRGPVQSICARHVAEDTSQRDARELTAGNEADQVKVVRDQHPWFGISTHCKCGAQLLRLRQCLFQGSTLGGHAWPATVVVVAVRRAVVGLAHGDHARLVCVLASARGGGAGRP